MELSLTCLKDFSYPEIHHGDFLGLYMIPECTSAHPGIGTPGLLPFFMPQFEAGRLQGPAHGLYIGIRGPNQKGTTLEPVPRAQDLLFCLIFVSELVLRFSAFGQNFLNMRLAFFQPATVQSLLCRPQHGPVRGVFSSFFSHGASASRRCGPAMPCRSLKRQVHQHLIPMSYSCQVATWQRVSKIGFGNRFGRPFGQACLKPTVPCTAACNRALTLL